MKVGLALAGGGVPGIAAVGALLALEEAGIRVTHIAGASSGAMVAALYAYGYTPSELTEIVPVLNRRYLDVDWRSILYKALFLRPNLEGFLKGDRLLELMSNLTEDKPLAALKIPCGIVSTDMNEGDTVVYSAQPVDGYPTIRNISIAEAVRASFSIPALFQPPTHEGRMMVDGGVSSNCPVRVCKALGAERVIAIDPITPIAASAARPTTIYEMLHKVIHLQLKLQMEQEHRHADVSVYPDTGPVGPFDFHKANDCIVAGRAAIAVRMEEIASLWSETDA